MALLLAMSLLDFAADPFPAHIGRFPCRQESIAHIYLMQHVRFRLILRPLPTLYAMRGFWSMRFALRIPYFFSQQGHAFALVLPLRLLPQLYLPAPQQV
ncbi:hypothetical protein AM586_11820 [Massilia sp. WG5]|nr:hypothetical protein AM586_11820 [Massilia sp. WG5]